MADATIVLTIFDKFLKILGLIRKGKIKRDEKIDQALQALYKALNETKSYVASLNEGSARNRGKEHDIAYMWHEASVPIRHIDPDLAHRCFLKGSYWHEPESWSEARVEESRIALDQVLDSIKSLLLQTRSDR